MTQSDGIEFAWRVHTALDSWTGKVDTKASIALAIESAMFGFAITLSEGDRPFAELGSSGTTWYYIGLGLLLASAALALAVVLPQLSRWRSRRGARVWESNTIYFGHLRHWDLDRLADRLRRIRDEEKELAQQLVTMSRIAWRKHSFLQGSLVLFSGGVSCLVLVAIMA